MRRCEPCEHLSLFDDAHLMCGECGGTGAAQDQSPIIATCRWCGGGVTSDHWEDCGGQPDTACGGSDRSCVWRYAEIGV